MPNLSEAELTVKYKEYLEERQFLASNIPVSKIKTPDFDVRGGSHDNLFLNEFKAPELLFNDEKGLFVFKTTHSKLLEFISKAKKQFESYDTEHQYPWVLTFCSTHAQLHSISLFQTLQGGIVQNGEMNPDFRNTDMYKRAQENFQHVDMYLWLQSNAESGNIHQASIIINEKSERINAIQEIADDLRSIAVNNMSLDRFYTL